VRTLLLAFLLWSAAPVVWSQEAVPAKTPLRVAVAGAIPFVISNDDNTFTGYSIEVWEDVAAHNDWTFVYTKYATKMEALAAMERNEVDVIVGDLGILSILQGKVEFSQPYFRSGLHIMVTNARPHTLGRILSDIYNWGHLRPFWYLLGAIVIGTVFVTWFERKHNPDFPKGHRDALAEAFYYVISLSLGKSAYKGFGGWFGRIVMCVWTILSVVIVAYVTSSITSAMTVESLRGHIQGPGDLHGHTVGVVKDTAAVLYLREKMIDTVEYPDLDTAVKEGLLNGQVPALVGAAPELQYYDKNHPQLPITEVGPVFSPYNYGFALPLGSPLRVPMNSAILELQERGTLLDLGLKYFGSVYQP